MFSSNFFAGAGVLFILLLLILLFLLPMDKKKGRGKKQGTIDMDVDQKDWKKTSLRLEKHIYALRQEIEVLEKKDKTKEKQVIIENVKAKKASLIHA